jgi:hypothetical protein
MVLRIHALIEAVILHPGIFAGFLERDRAVGAAYLTAEGLGPVIDVMQSCELQSGIAAAHIAAQPHLSIGLGGSAASEGAIGPRSNHPTRLEPCSSQ